MQPKKARAAFIAIATTMFAVLCASPAEGAEKGLIVRASATQMMPDLSYRTSTDNGWPIDVSSSSDTGWGLDLEIAVTQRLGIGIQFAQASPELRVDVDPRPVYAGLESRDRLDVLMYAASLNLHLTPGRAVDLYVRPVVAYLSFGELTFDFEGPGDLDDTLRFDVRREVTWGVGIGADVAIGRSGWLVTASATYLDSTLEVRQIDESDTEMIGFDPLMVSAGFGFRF